MALRTLVGLLLLFGQAAADEALLNASHPDRYRVVKGDTLWDIAGRFLRQPWRWPEIWHENPQIENPHWIYPGDLIVLTYQDGRPRLTVQRGEPLVSWDDTAFDETRLGPRVRTSPLAEAIPVIPIDAVKPFLTKARVVSNEELAEAPYVIDLSDNRLIGGEGDRIYVRHLGDHGGGDSRYGLYRRGQIYLEPRTQEILGFEAVYVADAQVLRRGDPATLLLTKASQAANVGDRLLPGLDEKIYLNYFPHPPRVPIEGEIISVPGGVTQIGQFDVVVIDRGVKDGIDTGTVLEIYQSAGFVSDRVGGNPWEKVRMPNEKVGVLMVFRPFERVSYALVMKATRALHILDAVANP